MAPPPTLAESLPVCCEHLREGVRARTDYLVLQILKVPTATHVDGIAVTLPTPATEAPRPWNALPAEHYDRLLSDLAKAQTPNPSECSLHISTPE